MTLLSGFHIQVIIYTSDEELEQARQTHPREFGWKEGNTTWIRESKLGKISAKIFWKVA